MIPSLAFPMRSFSFRLALPLAAFLVALPLGRLAAADPSPISPAPAPAPGPLPTPSANPAPGPDTTATPAPAPATVSAPAPAPAPVTVPDQDTAEAKLAVVLRSYALMQEENDQLRAAQEKYAVEKSGLEAQLSVAKDALPLATQVAGLREQLRQTQDQLAATSLENNRLKTRLAMGAPAPGTGNLTPINVPTSLPPAVAPAPAPAVRVHVVVAGETLGKISRKYYGSTSRWPEILAANRDVLKDEKSLVAGMKLKIP